MRKLILIAILAFFTFGLIGYSSEMEKRNREAENGQIYKIPNRQDTLLAMAHAFARVESRFNENAVSKCGRWVGCLQLSKIAVDEVNRILGRKRYYATGKLDDRFDRLKSFEMFVILQNRHNPTLDINRAIDIWNKRCPVWYRNDVTKHYNYYINNTHELTYFTQQ